MLRFSQNMSLQQRMAPQLIQSLQLLQMSTLELELEIQQQMELNPLLEDGVEAAEETEEPEVEIAEVDGLQEEAELPEDFEEVNIDAFLDDHFDQSSYNNEATEYDPNWEQDREPQENRITTMPPLAEQITEQLIISSLEGPDVEIAEFIIGNIDDRGYLACSIEDIAEGMGIPLGDVERVLAVVQSFDPPGIAARDLRECLLIQLERLDDAGTEVALQVVLQHMEDLTKRRFSRITRGLEISEDELKMALSIIERLQPNPGATSRIMPRRG